MQAHPELPRGGLGFRGIKYKAVEQIKCQDGTELPSRRLSPQEPPQTIPVRLTPLPGGWWGPHEVTQDLFPRHSVCYMVEVMGLGLVARSRGYQPPQQLCKPESGTE